MKKCFGYIRVSTVKQGEGVSLEAQKEAIEVFSERNDIEIIKWFEEKETAAKKGRPLFNGMMQQLKKRHAEGLVIHKIDRSARNFADWAKIGELQDRGIDIHFATESLDFASRGGRLTADIQAVIAADYVRNLREESIKGQVGRLKQGLYPYRAPIGYLDNGAGNPKTPDPIRAPLIRQLFELYAYEGYSLRALQLKMGDLGLRNIFGKKLSVSGIVLVLDNPFYSGVIRIRRSGQTYSGKQEVIVPPRLFQRVQEVRAGRTFKKSTKHNHTYQRLLNCALCRSILSAETQKGHVYYRCHQRGCPTKTLREEVVEREMVRFFNRFKHSLAQQRRLRDGLAHWLKTEDKMLKPQSSIKLQMTAVDQRLERLTDALIDSIIDQQSFDKRRQSLLLDRSSLEAELAKINNQRQNQSDIEKFLELANALGLQFQKLKRAEKREFVKMFTSNRLVSGKNLTLEPQNWLHSLEFLLYVPFGPPCRNTNRTCALPVKDVFGEFIEEFRGR